MRPPRALTLVPFALAACSTVPAGPPPEQSFRAVKVVALVRRLELHGSAPGPGEARRADPLDALQGALADRGLKVVTVELTDRPAPETAPLDQAAQQAEWIAQAARADSGGSTAGSIGERAAPVLAQLGADAFAVYSRGLGWGAPPRPSPRFGPSSSMAPPPVPSSAIAVVARDGTVVTFAWGGGAEPYGAGLANAAEAVEAVLALLLPPPPE